MAPEIDNRHTTREGASAQDATAPRGDSLGNVPPARGIRALANEADVFSTTDAEILASRGGSDISSGDEEVWTSFVKERHGAIVRTAARIVGYSDAEDIAQDAWLKAYAAREGYLEGNPDGWMHRITKNAGLDRARKKSRIGIDPTAPEDMPQVENTVFQAPGGESSAGITESSELSQKLIAAGVESDNVTAVLMKNDGASQKEISEALNVPLGTVQSRIHRGRLAIRALAEENGGGVFDPEAAAWHAERFEEREKEGNTRMGSGPKKKR